MDRAATTSRLSISVFAKFGGKYRLHVPDCQGDFSPGDSPQIRRLPFL